MSRVRLSAVAVVLLVLLGALGVGLLLTGRDGPAAASGPAASLPPVPEERQVLAAWDARRAAAYAEGDVDALAGLYVAGSRTAEADIEMLVAYVERGLVVRGMDTQVLSAAVVRGPPGTLTLRVTDRLVGAEAVGAGGRTRLPADLPSERLVRLARRDGQWLVEEVELSPGVPSR